MCRVDHCNCFLFSVCGALILWSMYRGQANETIRTLLEQVKNLKQAGAKESLDVQTKANKLIASLHEKLEQKEKQVIALEGRLAREARISPQGKGAGAGGKQV